MGITPETVSKFSLRFKENLLRASTAVFPKDSGDDSFPITIFLRSQVLNFYVCILLFIISSDIFLLRMIFHEKP